MFSTEVPWLEAILITLIISLWKSGDKTIYVHLIRITKKLQKKHIDNEGVECNGIGILSKNNNQNIDGNRSLWCLALKINHVIPVILGFEYEITLL